MKKIISVFALTSLAFGAAFADVKFTTNYRTQAQAFSRVMAVSSEANKALLGADSTAYGELYKTYLLRQSKGTDDATDSLQFAASNDFAGVTVQINPYAYASKKELKKDDDQVSNLGFKRYTGYIKLGPLTLNAGYWGDGVMSADYNVGKKDSDGTSLAGRDFLAYKPGSIYSGASTYQMDDITSFGGTAAPSVYVEYKGDLGDAEIAARLSAISLTGSTWDGDDVYSGFAAQLDTKFETFDAEFTFKQASIKSDTAERAISLYLQPLTWSPLTAMFGASAGFYEGELAEYNGEARFRYASGPFAVSFVTTASHVTRYGLTKKHKKIDYKQHIGAEYLKTGTTATFVKNTAASSAMWNALSVSFKLNDRFKPFITAGDIVGFKSYNTTKKDTLYFGDYGIELFVEPGVQIFASSNAFVTAACRIGFSHVGVETGTGLYHKDFKPEMAILVPVIMRVKL